MDNFDNFYGSDNFDGSRSTQVIIHEQKLVCHTEQIQIIQQRLVILQEMAKRYGDLYTISTETHNVLTSIITEQICEVETQTIVFEQFHSSLGSFRRDLTRSSGHSVGYDHNIAGQLGSIVGSDGSISSHDLGFSGHDVGNQTVVADGSNWNNQTSPASVNAALSQARNASSFSHS